MKRIMMVLMLLWGITAVAVGQERIKKVVELKNGTTITGYVMEQENGNYMLETESGDVLFYTREEVRSIRNFNQETESVLYPVTGNNAKLTYKKPTDLLQRGGFGLEFVNSKESLRSDQVSSDFWQKYQKASRNKRGGMTMTIIGGASLITGFCLWAADDWDSGNPIDGIGIGVGAVGLGVATWGVIRFICGNSQLGKLAKQYNNGNGYTSELSLDYSPRRSCACL